MIIDLLPKEHRAAWIPDERVTGVSIEFVDPTGKPGGHFAKAAKGELARAILTDGLGAVDRWRHDRFELAVTSDPGIGRPVDASRVAVQGQHPHVGVDAGRRCG